jgi:hypothetical protein
VAAGRQLHPPSGQMLEPCAPAALQSECGRRIDANDRVGRHGVVVGNGSRLSAAGEVTPGSEAGSDSPALIGLACFGTSSSLSVCHGGGDAARNQAPRRRPAGQCAVNATLIGTFASRTDAGKGPILEAMKSTGDSQIDALFRVRKGRVELVEVPELAFLVVDGGGDPSGEAFHDAIQALYSVSYGVHFAVKKATGQAPRVMPLEALWWAEGTDAQATMERIAAGNATMNESDRDRWRWRAMICQLAPIHVAMIEQAIDEAKANKDIASLAALRSERWEEGLCAQIMHIGPYAAEPASIVALHKAIAELGSVPRGRHHEIYLGDPRTSAPEKLRTILRQPIQRS